MGETCRLHDARSPCIIDEMAAPRPGLIVADDLTGACDTGVQFASPGSPASVLIMHGDTVPDGAQLPPLIADTESRHLSADQAADRVRTVAQELRGAPSSGLVFKKIDSTLRGNIGAEVAALAGAFPDRAIIVAPAFPEGGRTTVDGRCLVHGVPVDETEFARDRLSPVRSASVAELLRPWFTGKQIAQANPASLAEHLAEEHAGGIVIVDASSGSDLDEVARVVDGRLDRLILVGSAGLANALAARRASRGGSGASLDSAEAGRAGSSPVVAVVGSLSERSRLQARRLAAHHGVREVVLDPGGGAGAAAEQTLAASAAGAVEETLAALAAGEDVVVVTAVPDGGGSAATSGAAAVVRGASEAASTAAACAELVRRVVERDPEVGLFLTGGDTALAVVRGLGSTALRVYREVAPGVPAVGIVLARTADTDREIRAVTKAGGFGDDEVMVRARECLREGTCWQ